MAGNGVGKRGRDKRPRKRRTDSATNPPPKSPGRRGARNPLPSGVVAAIEAINAARERARESMRDDPMADEAEGIVLSIMRGNVGRHTVARLGAAVVMLDRRRGKPKQPLEHTGELTLLDLVPGDTPVTPEGIE